ncbi:hypothetical protein N2152v2_010884 [Parachlorella kessleri]
MTIRGQTAAWRLALSKAASRGWKFENKTLPLEDPSGFKVEILFSPGAAYNPVETVPLKKDHVLPVMPRVPIHLGGGQGVPLQKLETMTKPFAKPFKCPPEPYMQTSLNSQTPLQEPYMRTNLNSQNSELDYWLV